MPKLIDYPRTSYTGAWELAEVTDDTGGKCAIETAARKMDRKVSGSFKAIIGSAVKFGLLTSKRDLLTTTTLFKRIKHAYDKQEELIFHREAFLTPPLFTQICRKFRSRELPVQMLDVMLIREFGVEEINAQGVAKAFVEGARMVGILDEHNTIADIDSLANKQSVRRELASPTPKTNTFRPENELEKNSPEPSLQTEVFHTNQATSTLPFVQEPPTALSPAELPPITDNTDAIASLFGFGQTTSTQQPSSPQPQAPTNEANLIHSRAEAIPAADTRKPAFQPTPATTSEVSSTYQIQISGPGIGTTLSIIEEEDIALAIALLEKIRRQLRNL